MDASALGVAAIGLAGAASLALLTTFVATLWGRLGMSDRLRRTVDAMLLLAVLAGAVMALLAETTEIPKRLAPADRVLFATVACLLVLGLRRFLGNSRAPEADVPVAPVAVLRRPEQWTLLGNLIVAIGLAMALAAGVYELLGGDEILGRPGTVSDLLAAVGLWGALYTVLPWGGALVALKTALGLRWVPIGLLALAGLIGCFAGGLITVATFGNYPNFPDNPFVFIGRSSPVISSWGSWHID